MSEGTPGMARFPRASRPGGRPRSRACSPLAANQEAVWRPGEAELPFSLGVMGVIVGEFAEVGLDCLVGARTVRRIYRMAVDVGVLDDDVVARHQKRAKQLHLPQHMGLGVIAVQDCKHRTGVLASQRGDALSDSRVG